MRSKTDTALLGTEKISTLLFQYAIPSIIAMSAAALYNIVASVFIGHGVGHLAITALAVVLPLSNLSMAFGAMVGIGASSLLSIKLGQQDNDSARVILGNVVMLTLIIGIVFGILCLLFLDPILYLFGASDATIGYAREYMRILLVGTAITHTFFGLNHTLRASGFPRKSMSIMLISMGINIVLTALFIMGFNWGMAGAAWATMIAQCVALGFQITHFANPKHDVSFSREIFRLRRKIVQGILSIGAAPFCMNVGATVVVILINITLRRHGGDIYVGAYGIVNRMLLIFLMIMMGLNQGMQPIVGYNYGARRFDRAKLALKKVTFAAIGIAGVGFILSFFVPHWVAMAFTDHPGLIDVSSHALRISMIVFPVVGFQVVASSFFQSIGKATIAILLSLTRQFLFLIPLLIFLPRMMGVDGVWWSMPISDFASAILATALLSYQLKMLRDQQPVMICKTDSTIMP